jgi:invasion protein IalB
MKNEAMGRTNATARVQGSHWLLAIGLGLGLALATGGSALAQAKSKPAAAAPSKPADPAPAPTPAPAADQAAKPPGGWSSRCLSESRGAPPECVVEQNAFVTNTGQLVASVTIRLPADTRQPVMMVQVPVGLYVPFGITFQIDDGKPESLPIQTCDLKGCYAGAPVAADRLAALKSGKRLAIGFQNLQRQSINIPFVLQSFAETYQKVQ